MKYETLSIVCFIVAGCLAVFGDTYVKNKMLKAKKEESKNEKA